MECSHCNLHCKYLERLVDSKNEEILFLRSMISNKVNLVKDSMESIHENVHVQDSIFDIIDYKTDKVLNLEEIDRKTAVYGPQLKLYSKVLAFILKIDESVIHSKLLFVRPGKVVDLSL